MQASFIQSTSQLPSYAFTRPCRQFTTHRKRGQDSGPAENTHRSIPLGKYTRVLRTAYEFGMEHGSFDFRQTSRKAPKTWCRVRAADGQHPCQTHNAMSGPWRTNHCQAPTTADFGVYELPNLTFSPQHSASPCWVDLARDPQGFDPRPKKTAVEVVICWSRLPVADFLVLNGHAITSRTVGRPKIEIPKCRDSLV
jgi:hypothetical protein